MVSGHKSELLPCGISPATLHLLAKDANIDEDTVRACAYYLTTGRWVLTHHIMQLECGKGWCLESTRLKVTAGMHRLAHVFRPQFSPWKYENPRNSLVPFFDQNVIAAIDTVPIYVDAGEHTFQPKYGEDVLKVLVAATFTGFTLFVSRPYKGQSSDSAILGACKVMDSFPRNTFALADGAFKHTNLWKPPTKTGIYPKRLRPGQTVQQYEAESTKKLEDVEKHARFRSRIEHQFGRGMFGRFSAFKNWTCRTDSDFLRNSIDAAFGMINAEVYTRHGAGPGSCRKSAAARRRCPDRGDVVICYQLLT
jgi:hypothetical protein